MHNNVKNSRWTSAVLFFIIMLRKGAKVRNIRMRGEMEDYALREFDCIAETQKYVAGGACGKGRRQQTDALKV